MKVEAKLFPPLPHNRGKHRSLTDINGRRRRFQILDEIKRVQSNAPHKAIYLQRIQFEDENRIELRLAYYIIGKKPRMKGKWVFGQYATLMPAKDFKTIIRAAKQRGWI